MASAAIAQQKSGGIPPEIRKWYERGDRERAALLREHDRQMAGFRAGVRSLTGEAKIEMSRELRKVEKANATAKTKDWIAQLPSKPTIDSIGAMRHCVVQAVLDDKSVLVSYAVTDPTGTKEHRQYHAIIQSIDTKKLKFGKAMSEDDVYQVIKVATDDRPLANDPRLKGLKVPPPNFIVEPVKKKDVEKYRALFEASKNAKEAKAGGKAPVESPEQPDDSVEAN